MLDRCLQKQATELPALKHWLNIWNGSAPDDYTDINTLIGIESDDNTAWGSADNSRVEAADLSHLF